MTEFEEREIRLLGASYRTAPVEVRESLGRLVADAEATLGTEAPSDVELLSLSTCNRTEIYACAAANAPYLDSWFRRLRTRATLPGESSELIYQLRGQSAVQHLFRVACGLDSAVLGDVQILSQIKEARTIAKTKRTLGVFLEQLTNVAVRAGKRARNETEIGYGAASVGSALTSMLRRRSSSGALRVLLIGAGDAARNIGNHIVKSKLGTIVCINRTRDKANELARRLGGKSRPWSELEDALHESDIVIAATSAAEPVLRKSELDELARRRRGESIVIVDAGVPRNVEPGSCFHVIGIDDVREHQEQVTTTRRAAVPSVERIIRDGVEEWARWVDSRPIEAAVRSLYQDIPGYTRQAAAHLTDNGALTSERVEQILAKSIRQLLHAHVHRLRRLERR